MYVENKIFFISISSALSEFYCFNLIALSDLVQKIIGWRDENVKNGQKCGKLPSSEI